MLVLIGYIQFQNNQKYHLTLPIKATILLSSTGEIDMNITRIGLTFGVWLTIIGFGGAIGHEYIGALVSGIVAGSIWDATA